MNIVNMVLFSCSDKAEFITGGILYRWWTIRQMIYYGDCGCWGNKYSDN
ncbi:MAG: hypothetical protein IJE43_04235 [Alphaproteobacteria bacterium]|nr:hypothetical protein [Alphaproteobacteria bacterium]